MYMWENKKDIRWNEHL